MRATAFNWAVSGIGSMTVAGSVVSAGRVPVKVTSYNGDIQPGDSITSSNYKGIGMKSTKSGTTIGKATISIFSGKINIELY